MSEMSRVRKGDKIRVTLEGVVTSPGESPANSPGVVGGEGSWCTISLAVGGRSMDASIGWDKDTAVPEVEILSTKYEPGDVAMLRIGNGQELLVFRMRSVNVAEGDYWMAPAGRRWFENYGPEKITILHRAEDLIREAF